jgi:HAD superfamily hydrolase (TIGR01509 family)
MKPETVTKAVLFDVGWTLIYPKPTRKEATERYLLALGYSFPPEDLESANRVAVNFYRIHRWQPEAVQNITQFWQEYYSIFVEHLRVNDPGLPIALSDQANRAVQFHLYPETRPILQELHRRGYLVGAVSNWSSELPNILKDLRLIDCLDSLVVSDQIGYHKPQPEIFRYALDSLGVPAISTVHIGDDLQADVEGARQVGIKPIWLDRNARDDITRSHRIQSLDELFNILTNS